jgi:hypothetical protein
MAIEPGDGLGTMLHAVPLKCSMRVWLPGTSTTPLSPTAHTSRALFALIPLNRKNALMCGLLTGGIGTTAQAVPLKCSEKVWFCPVAESRNVPTIHTSSGPSAEIAFSVVLDFALAGSGKVTGDQAVPFQCASEPTAVAALSPIA